jgi:hypothetical protein
VGLEPCFYPGLDPSQDRSGSVPTFDQARADFEVAWASLLPELPAGAFDEYRRDREFRAEIGAVHARGEKLPSEVPSSMMRCFCGVRFDSHKPAESYDHRLHVYAAQSKGRPGEVRCYAPLRLAVLLKTTCNAPPSGSPYRG